MNLPVALLLLFLIGILHDVLWTLYIRAISVNRRTRAAVVSGLLTAFGFTAWALVAKTGAESTIPGILCYSVGGALGTFMCFGSKAVPKPDTESPAG